MSPKASSFDGSIGWSGVILALPVHVADGILPVAGCVAAHIASSAWLYSTCRDVQAAEASRMGLASAAAFVVSTVQFPIAGLPAHLGLYGLIGILLGKRAFPVLYVCLLFQSLLLQNGGLLSLGVNSLNMGLGAFAGWWLWRLVPARAAIRALLAGFVGALLPALLLAWEFELADYGRGFYVVASLYAVIAAVEAAVTTLAVSFLGRTKPDILLPAPS